MRTLLLTIIISISLFAVSLFVIRFSVSALSWEQINEYGFDGDINSGTYDLVEYQGKLYASSNNGATYAEIWSYDGSTWSQVNQDGFDSEADPNEGVFAMEVYAGKLFAGTRNSASGAEVWSYDGSTWTRNSDGGFGDPNNTQINGMTVYDGELIVGTVNTSSGTQLWSYDGSVWSQINIDGFGDVSNMETVGLTEFDGNLYAGTTNFSGADVWKYDGSYWQLSGPASGGEIVSSFLVNDEKLYAGITNMNTGAEIWVYDLGAWTQINDDGFGDPFGWFVYGIVELNGKIYVAADNILCWGEIWAFDGSDWTEIVSDGFGGNNFAVSMTTYQGNVIVGAENTGFGGLGAGVWSSYYEADLQLEATHSLEEDRIVYDFTVTNNGPDFAGDIIVTLSGGYDIDLLFYTQSDWNCSEVDENIVCTLDVLDNTESSSLVLHTTPPIEVGNYEITLSVTSDALDQEQDDNSYSFSLEIEELSETGSIINLCMISGLFLTMFVPLKKLSQKALPLLDIRAFNVCLLSINDIIP
ncbi:MAG: hypothetical protein ABIE03_04430 [Patescibacteria group bacterium]|nr:hypothetical protein [Patescibacteria group bacterium]